MPQQIGSYQVQREIGRGGMGVVYLGRDTTLDRPVAIKAMPEELAHDPARLVRFEREAKSLAQLNHPNVAGIYGVEEVGGRRYLILEYVEGETIAERLDAGPLAIEDALDLAVEIAAGIEAAHEAGVIHRDLKPDNIKITPEGKAKVLDFGLAKAATTGTSNPLDEPTVTSARSPTIPGAILGTAAYMSPEQARARTVDKRSDIWSFGVVLFEMLAGAGPFAGESAHDSIGAVLHKDIDFARLPPQTPAPIGRLVRRCLQRDRDRRLQSIADARVEIQETIDQLESGVIEVSAIAARRPVWVLLVLVAIGVLVGLGGGWWFAGPQGWGREAQSLAPLRLTFTRVTDDEGAETQPSLSPDGRDVVFSAKEDGDWDIFRKRVGSLNAINLTAGFDENDTAPAVSPDGEFIAFRSSRDGGGLFVMGAMGDSPRRLTDFGFDPAWSPDGQTIVFALEEVVDPLSRNLISTLWSVPASGGTPTQIVVEGDAVQPSVSPSGLRIAYWRYASPGGIRDVLTVGIEGGEPVHVTDDVATDWCPFWSPDGKLLYFVSDRSGVMNLWQIAIDETSGEVLGEPTPVTSGVGTVHFAAIAASGAAGTAGAAGAAGAVIAITSTASDYALYHIEIDPENGTLIGSPSVVAPNGTQPAFSPDGTMIAYAQGGEDLFIVNVDGSGKRRLTDDDFKNRGPIWLGDGQRLLFYSDMEDGYEVWSCAIDGSDLRRHTNAPFDVGTPQVSPDGKRFVFSIPEGGTYLQNLMPRGLSPLTELDLELGDAMTEWLDWSADGKRVSGVMIRDNTEGEFVMLNVNDGTVERLAVVATGIVSMPDGNRFVLIGENRSRLLLYDPRTGEKTTILNEPNLVISQFALSPDGRSIVYTAEELNADLWIGTFEPNQDGANDGR
jgi:eukaryotic-like serine/threonine-protein kinase